MGGGYKKKRKGEATPLVVGLAFFFPLYSLSLAPRTTPATLKRMAKRPVQRSMLPPSPMVRGLCGVEVTVLLWCKRERGWVQQGSNFGRNAPLQ